MEWWILGAAGLLETAWAVALKASQGLSRFWPSLLCALAMLGSVLLLGLAMRALPLGTAYAVWTGIGAAGAALVGMLFFQEPATAWRLACIGLILAGTLGLKLGQGH